MRAVKLFFANALLSASASILLRLISVWFNAYISAKIGAEGMGIFTLTMSAGTLAVTLAISGVHLAAVRLTAEADACGQSLRAVMRGCILYSLLFGVFASAVLFSLSKPIGTHLLADTRTVPSLRVLALSLPALSLTTALSGYFTGMRRVYKNVLVSLTEQFVKIGLCTVLLLLLAPAGVEYACLALVGGAALAEGCSLLLSLTLYLTDNSRKAKTDAQEKPALRAVGSVAFPVAVGSYARQGLLTAEHLAIPWGLKRSGSAPEAALACYGVLHGMVFPLVLFPSAVLGAFAGLLVPEFTEAQKRGQTERIRRMAEKVLRTSLLFSIGVSGIFLSFASEIGGGMYPGTDAGKFLTLLAPLIPVMYLDGAVDAMLKGLGEQTHCMKINIADSALSLVLVILLLPRFGIHGYVAVLYVCELMNAALSISRLLTVSRLRVRIWQWILKPLLCVILSTSAVRLLSAYGVLPLIGAGESPAARIALSAVLYAVLTAASGAVNKADFAFLRGIFSQKAVNNS